MKIINATEDDIAGIALSIVDKMVAEGLIPNCTDTNDESEFEAQDIIREKLNELTINQSNIMNTYMNINEME